MTAAIGAERTVGSGCRYCGVCEPEVILTSPPGQAGILTLKGSENLGDLQLTATLRGNVMGEQSIYLRRNSQDGAI